jgi:hypothetical protein
MHVLIVIRVQIGGMIEAGAMVSKGRGMCRIGCERLVGLAGESHGQGRRCGEVGIGTAKGVLGVVFSPFIAR